MENDVSINSIFIGHDVTRVCMLLLLLLIPRLAIHTVPWDRGLKTDFLEEKEGQEWRSRWRSREERDQNTNNGTLYT